MDESRKVNWIKFEWNEKEYLLIFVIWLIKLFGLIRLNKHEAITETLVCHLGLFFNYCYYCWLISLEFISIFLSFSLFFSFFFFCTESVKPHSLFIWHNVGGSTVIYALYIISIEKNRFTFIMFKNILFQYCRSLHILNMSRICQKFMCAMSVHCTPFWY